MKKLASFAIVMSIAASVSSAQSLSGQALAHQQQVREPIPLGSDIGGRTDRLGSQSSAAGSTAMGTFGNIGGFEPAGRIILVADPRLGLQGEARGLQGHVGSAVAQAASASASTGASTGLVREVARSMRPVGGGSAARGRMTELGGFVAYEEDSDPRTTFTQLGGFVAYEEGGDGPRSTFRELGGFVAYEEDEGDGVTALGHVRQIGGAVARGEKDDKGYEARGSFAQIGIGPLPCGVVEEELEPDPVLVSAVTLYGRSGSSYAIVLQSMGSANGPHFVLAQGMLFGEDPAEGLRKLQLRVPAELAVLLIPLE